MRGLSIKIRLFIYSMLFCFVGLTLLGGYSYFTARNALLKRTFSQLTSIREEKARQVEQFFRDRIREGQLIANNGEIKRITNDFSTSRNLRISDLQSNNSFFNLLLFLKSAECYSSISFGLPNGSSFCLKLNEDNLFDHYIFTNLESRKELKSLYEKVQASGKVEISDLTKGTFIDGYSAFIASPIMDGARLVAVVFMEIPDQAMNRLMADRIDPIALGKTGEVYLTGSDYLMRSSSRFMDNSVLKVTTKTIAVEKALNGSAGTAKITDYRGVNVLSSFSPINIPNLNWVVVAEMDWNEALHDTVLLKNRILIIGFVIFVLITLGVLMFSWVITNPLVKLKEAAIRVGEGKFDWVIPVRHRDEIGLLTQVFNKMTLRLKHTTQRLKEREQRLLHFYRATVDGILFHKAGKTILVNRALINLTGFTEDELLKTSPEAIFADDDYLFKLNDKAEVHFFETVLVTKKNEKIPVEVQHRRMNYHDQEVEVMVIRNISERKAIEDELKVERLHRLRSVIDGQEQERQRLSRELHDGLGQTLVAIKLRLESIPVDKLGDQQKTVEMVKQMFNQTIEETRRISNNLMPAALTQFSLAVVLRNLCNEVEANSGITVSLVVGVLPDSLDMLTKTYAYRIVQEALTNIVKHSNAKRAVVSVFSDIHKLFLHIEDNGAGFNKGKISDIGNGLYNMKERASLLHGKFEIITTPGKGTMVKVEFPITNIKDKRNEQ
jgi:PAS domain S-box-containing protein